MNREEIIFDNTDATLNITAEDLIKKGNCSKIPLSQIYQELNEVIVYKFLLTYVHKSVMIYL